MTLRSSFYNFFHICHFSLGLFPGSINFLILAYNIQSYAYTFNLHFIIYQFINFSKKTQVWLNSYPKYIYNKIIIKIIGYFWGVTLTFYMPPVALIRRLDDMLSSPLGQHIIDYEPPHGFVIPAFTTFDGSANPYNHMLYYNQEMILNADNDRLLCKVFPASLRGLALACFHKLPCNSINSFNELWAAFIS